MPESASAWDLFCGETRIPPPDPGDEDLVPGFPADLLCWDETPLPDKSDAQLVAAVLGAELDPFEAVRTSRHLLDVSAGLYGLARSPRFFLEYAGIDPAPARAIEAAILLASRVALCSPPLEPLTPEVLVGMFRPLLAPLPHEEMHLVLLDATGRYRGRRRLSLGGHASCSLYVKDVLAPVLEARAPAFVLVHNHPSGCAEPSAEDLLLTKRIANAAGVVATRLVDHLIVVPDAVASAMPDEPVWNPGTRRDTGLGRDTGAGPGKNAERRRGAGRGRWS